MCEKCVQREKDKAKERVTEKENDKYANDIEKEKLK